MPDVRSWSLLLAAALAFPACDGVLDPADPVADYVDVTVGARHTCALRADGAIFCWGDNEWGQLGGEKGSGSEPVRVGGEADRFIQVDAGNWHTCALRWSVRGGGEPWCWGHNAYGQLGDGTEIHRFGPVAVDTRSRFSEIRAGGAHTCGITIDRELFCWGRNRDGQLGIGTLEPHTRPQPIAGLALWEQVDAGIAHTCAVDRFGEAFCWGSYYFPYTFFRPHEMLVTEPIPLIGEREWRSVSAGHSHTCGITRAGAGFCLGYNSDGQVGNGVAEWRMLVDTLALVSPASGEWAELIAGINHSCGLTTTGELYCWGDNAVAQLGDGTRVDRHLPRRVLADERWTAIRPGDVHSCALAASGRVVCWGVDSSGQLGPDPLFVSSVVPEYVLQHPDDPGPTRLPIP